MTRMRRLGSRRGSPVYRTAAIWDPGRFQDGRRRRGYFEGWYFKCVGAEGAHPIAVIPGVSLDRDGVTSHAFVQLIQTGGRTAYWEYPTAEFRFAGDGFDIEVGPNRFSPAGMLLDLHGDVGRVGGRVEFGEWNPWPVRTLSPGIMGWYRFVPFMETYHGVLSMDHALSGALEVDGTELSFEGGRGYTEKDWGRSFPSAWIWAQSNHFGPSGTASPGTSVSISVARIPWLGSSFVGYIVGLLHDGELHAFTTYNGAKVRTFSLRDGEANIVLTRGDLELAVSVEGAHPGKLRSPVLGAMEGVVWESLEAHVGVELRHGGDVLFAGTGRHAGVELMDDRGELESGLKR
jgi:tocopherol cyclase